MDRVTHDVVAEIVRGAVSQARLDAGAGQPNGETASMVIPAKARLPIVPLHEHRPPELAAPDDQRIIQKPALLLQRLRKLGNAGVPSFSSLDRLTRSLDRTGGIERLIQRFPAIEAHNEICRATQERQEAAVLAAKDVDCVVVVGSQRSSNSQRLVQVVEQLGGKPGFLVDNPGELNPDWFVGMRKVGVTAGASTPTQITRAVIAAIEAIPAEAIAATG